MADKYITLLIEETSRIDWLYKLDFPNQLLLAVPYLHQTLYISCDKTSKRWQGVTAWNCILVLITSMLGVEPHQLLLFIAPYKELWAASAEAHEQLWSLSWNDCHHFPVQTASLVDHCTLVLESPNLKQVLRADGEENAVLFNFVDLLHCLTMDWETGENVIHTVNLYENNGTFRETNDQELINLVAIWIFIELIVWISWTGIFIKVRNYLTIEFWWLRVSSSKACDALVQALSLIVFETLWFL